MDGYAVPISDLDTIEDDFNERKESEPPSRSDFVGQEAGKLAGEISWHSNWQ
jgi:hypothetical protein